ncbi:TPA: hypothetical protein KML44_004936, partial [Escherichia coli]|nr:hypothetical protein [Escherichia coli]
TRYVEKAAAILSTAAAFLHITSLCALALTDEFLFYSLFFPASELPYLQRNRKNHSGKQQDSHANRSATYYVLHQQV